MAEHKSRSSSRPVARRRFLALAGLGAAGLSIDGEAGAETGGADDIEPFYGPHQSGILTPRQAYAFIATFDLLTETRHRVADMLRAWTEAARLMASGEVARAPGDSGEALGLPAARLTVTFGFAAGFFLKDGVDRFGLAQQQPAALAPLPPFAGEQLQPEWTGGDLLVQASADDPQVAFHAVRQLALTAEGAAVLRWSQPGFVRYTESRGTPRNLLGFKDGTINPAIGNDAVMRRFIWVGAEGPSWMAGGSYVVVRRIRLALGDWDRLPVAAQERIIGRHKDSGAPLGQSDEFAPVDLLAKDEAGQSLIPHGSHLRLAARASYEGDPILRRPYSYLNGAAVSAPPTGARSSDYDAGLLFIAFQRDPRTAFIPMLQELAAKDALNRFATHVGSGLFACPPGIAFGQFIGQSLFCPAA
jgi:deferrochelatase/peroxidase EfeB